MQSAGHRRWKVAWAAQVPGEDQGFVSAGFFSEDVAVWSRGSRGWRHCGRPPFCLGTRLPLDLHPGFRSSSG